MIGTSDRDQKFRPIRLNLTDFSISAYEAAHINSFRPPLVD